MQKNWRRDKAVLILRDVLHHCNSIAALFLVDNKHVCIHIEDITSTKASIVFIIQTTGSAEWIVFSKFTVACNTEFTCGLAYLSL